MFRAFLLCCAILQAQPAAVTLPAIRDSVLADIRRTPDYTCTQRIERKAKSADTRTFETIDRARFEVSFAGGKELADWIGGDPIAPDELPRLTAGMVSNSEFAMHARTLLTGSRVQFSDAALDNAADGPSVRFDFRVPASGSDWVLSAGGREVPVGYHGSIRVNQGTRRLTQVDIVADALPAALGYSSVSKKLVYGDVLIKGEHFVLPLSSELLTSAPNGVETRNEAQFSDCRPWAGAAAAATPAGADLPDEINVELMLETAVDSDTASVGDPLVARLQQTIKRKKDVVVPKGAPVYGRISVLEVVDGFRIVDFAFSYFEADGKRIGLFGRSNMLEVDDRNTRGDKVLANPKMGPMSGKNVTTEFLRAPTPLQFNTRRARVPRGFKLYLRSNRVAAS